MTVNELSNIYNHCGYNAAMAAIEDEELTPGKKDDLYEELERLHEEDAEKLRRWTHPSRYPAAHDPHEF